MNSSKLRSEPKKLTENFPQKIRQNIENVQHVPIISFPSICGNIIHHIRIHNNCQFYIWVILRKLYAHTFNLLFHFLLFILFSLGFTFIFFFILFSFHRHWGFPIISTIWILLSTAVCFVLLSCYKTKNVTDNTMIYNVRNSCTHRM